MNKVVAVVMLSIAGATVASAGQSHHDFFGFGGQHAHRGSDVGPVSAPEIDPSSAISALTLLAGGITVLRSRFSKK